MYKDIGGYINTLVLKEQQKYPLLSDFLEGKIKPLLLKKRNQKMTKITTMRFNKLLLDLLDQAIDYLNSRGFKIKSKTELFHQLAIAFLTKVFDIKEDLETEKTIIIDPEIFVVYQGKKVKLREQKKEISEISKKIRQIVSLYDRLLEVHESLQKKSKQEIQVIQNILQRRIEEISNRLFSLLTPEFIDQLDELGKIGTAKRFREMRQKALIIVEKLDAFF